MMTTSNNIWQGNLVRLRGIELEDWEILYDWSLDTDFDRLSFKMIFPPSKEYMKTRTAELAGKDPTKEHDFLLMIENGGGEVVGNISAQNCDARHGTFSFGLGIRRQFWRKGYARESIWLLFRFFFRELGYQKVNSGVYVFNEASLALHHSLGFTEEGRLRRNIYSDGAYYDEIAFGMTREEFEANENFNRG